MTQPYPLTGTLPTPSTRKRLPLRLRSNGLLARNNFRIARDLPGNCQALARPGSLWTVRAAGVPRRCQCKFDNGNCVVLRGKELILADRPQILIQPAGRFLDQLVARKCVAGVVDQMLLLVFLRTEHLVERFLG